jgi:hypothetical protein
MWAPLNYLMDISLYIKRYNTATYFNTIKCVAALLGIEPSPSA